MTSLSLKSHLAPVVQRLDNNVHRINHYPADSVFVLSILIHWIVIYPLDSVIQPLNNRALWSIPRAIIGSCLYIQPSLEAEQFKVPTKTCSPASPPSLSQSKEQNNVFPQSSFALFIVLDIHPPPTGAIPLYGQTCQKVWCFSRFGHRVCLDVFSWKTCKLAFGLSVSQCKIKSLIHLFIQQAGIFL